MKRLLFAGILPAALCLCSLQAHAQVTVPTFFSTGVNSAGVPLTGGAADTHYTLTVPAGSAGGPAPVDIDNPGQFAWDGNTATSRWISPSTAGGSGAVGNYVYTTTFNLTGFDPTTARITGSISADDQATILLNGTQVGASPAGGYQFFTPVSITTGFQSGINTLTFNVNNSGGVTGLQFNATATASATSTAVPEPGSIALLVGLGVTGAGFLARKRRK